MSNYPSTPLMRSIAAAVAANVPVLIWGKPGSGKTAKISAWLDKWNFHCEVLVFQMTANDFNKYGCDLVWQITDQASGREVARGKHGIMFFDYSVRKPALVPPAFVARFGG